MNTPNSSMLKIAVLPPEDGQTDRCPACRQPTDLKRPTVFYRGRQYHVPCFYPWPVSP
jgi:hypothetical protein